MNAHRKLIDSFPSAYAMAKQTELHYSKCKRWARNGLISDPSAWRIIVRAADLWPESYWIMELAKDYRRAKNGE